jgi:hypothetical protein
VYDPEFDIAEAMVPTLSKFDACPFRRISVTVELESGSHVIIND